MKYSKLLKNHSKINHFSEHFFSQYIRDESFDNENHKKEHTEMKYFNNTRKNIVLKVNNSFFELEKRFLN